MSKITYGVDEDFVDKNGDDLDTGDVVRVDGMGDLWDVKDLWMADDIQMVTIENEIGNRFNVPTQCVLKM